jgi:hypothetical protein
MNRGEIIWGFRQVSVLTGVTLLLTVIVIGLLMPPSNQPRRNMAKVVGLLSHATRQEGSPALGGTPTVIVADGVTLAPERGQVAAGYVLTLHLRGAAFAIGANPIQPGRTGFLYFYRDGAGVVRFDGYKPAGESSRPYAR